MDVSKFSYDSPTFIQGLMDILNFYCGSPTFICLPTFPSPTFIPCPTSIDNNPLLNTSNTQEQNFLKTSELQLS